MGRHNTVSLVQLCSLGTSQRYPALGSQGINAAIFTKAKSCAPVAMSAKDSICSYFPHPEGAPLNNFHKDIFKTSSASVHTYVCAESGCEIYSLLRAVIKRNV